ncbi:hypothetical protein [Streptomyces sp. NPDC017940]|uniref:hypothetical protein n=1 Tax=Streptomyces sp. NPDC017940 TaxID=3365017 RepID=UPI003793F3F6
MRDVTEPLHLYVVPGAALLDVQQNAGSACAWCTRTLRPGQGINLGGSGSWLPHACRDCYDAQTRALATYLDWHDHAAQCPLCTMDPPCITARALGHAHLDALARAKKPKAFCSHCHHTVEPDTFRPYLFMGTTGMLFSYLHLERCHARPRGRDC